jgi:hypothetical protein
MLKILNVIKIWSIKIGTKVRKLKRIEKRIIIGKFKEIDQKNKIAKNLNH